MNRLILGLASAFFLTTIGSYSTAQRQASKDAPAGGVSEVRILVKQLEAQVASQRAALTQSEANLDQAKALLKALEGVDPDQKKLAELREDERRMARKLEEIGKQVRRANEDPAYITSKAKLESVREQIRKLESK